MSTVTAGEIAELFRVLGDPTRIEILRLLSLADEVACTTLDEILPISKSTISYHIKALKTVGLLTVRKDGRWYHYTLRRDRVETLLPGFFELLPALNATESLCQRGPNGARGRGRSRSNSERMMP